MFSLEHTYCSFISGDKNNAASDENQGAARPGLDDVGAPILCGNDQNLSYIMLPMKESTCDKSPIALHLVDHNPTPQGIVTGKPGHTFSAPYDAPD